MLVLAVISETKNALYLSVLTRHINKFIALEIEGRYISRQPI